MIALVIILIFSYSLIGYSRFFEKYEEIINTKYLKCLEHYNKYVKPIQDKSEFLEESYNKNDISFNYYLEYWWNLEESDEQLLIRVCNYISNKFPKRNIRYT